MTPFKDIASRPTPAKRMLRRLTRKLPSPVKAAARKVLNRPAEPRPTKTPTLTVVVPVYNVEDYIEETLDSLLSQSFTNWEAIIVDDGSTDGSSQIVSEYAGIDSRFRVIRQDNAGLGAARNTGIRAATGKYLTFLDSDDVIPPNGYQAAVSLLKKSKSDFAVGAIERLRGGKRITPYWTKLVHAQERIGINVESFPDSMMDVVACNRIFKRSFWDEQVSFFPVGVAYEDHRVMVAAAVRAGSFDVLTETTYLWRVRDDNTSISQQKDQLPNFLDRIRAKDETFELLKAEATAIALDAWLTRLIDMDIPLFANFALAADHEYRSHALDFAQRYSSIATNNAWENTRWYQRIKVLFMASGQWEALDQFLIDLRGHADVPGTYVQDGRVNLDLSLRSANLAALLSGKQVMGERQTCLVARVEQAHWTNRGLHLQGFAYISHLMPGESDLLEISLENSVTGYKYPLTEVRTTSSNQASTFANHESFDYRESGFIAEISWSDFTAIVGSEGFSTRHLWQIRVSRSNGLITRTGIMDTALRNGSGGVFTQNKLPDLFMSVLPHRTKNSYAIRFRTIKSMLTSVSFNDGSISGTIIAPAQSSSVPTEIFLADSDGTNAKLTSLPTSDDNLNTESYVFRNLKLADDGKRHRLRIEFENSSDYGVIWGLGQPEYLFKDSTSVRKSTLGYIDVESDTEDFTAESVYFAGNTLTVDVLGTSRDSPPSACSLTSILTTEHIPGSITPVGRGRLQLKFDLKIVTHNNGPVRGIYSVMINETVVTPSIGTALQLPQAHVSDYYRIETSRGSASDGRPLRLRFSEPLRDNEVGSWNQKQLRKCYRSTNFTPSNSVLFQCYKGETASDNQLEIHTELMTRNLELTPYWGVTDGSVLLPTGANRLIIGSQEWYMVLGSAKYLCNNIDFERFFVRGDFQSFLQTFHGHPFKSMGASFWSAQGGHNQRSIESEFERRQEAWTTALMPNEESIEYYMNEYSFNGEYLVAGYPRNDPIVSGDGIDARNAITDMYSLPRTASKWVVYAPTWRETLSTGSWSASMFDDLDLDVLAGQLGPDWTILIRGHNHNSRESARVARSASILDVTDYPDINDLILASDVAILDYSSLRFDWAITKKPVVFFVPDKDEYLTVRPGLFGFDESAPGAQVVTTEEVADEVLQYEDYTARFGNKLDAFNLRFNQLSDGKAAKRVVDSFFSNEI